MGGKARPKKRYLAVVVQWVDAQSTYGWQEDDTYRPVPGGGPRCLTRGYMVAEDKDSISVAQNIGVIQVGGTRTIAEVIQIPRKWITRMKTEVCPWVEGN